MAVLVSVAVDPPAGTVAAGDTLEFDAVGTYDDATTRELDPYEVTFTTSDPAVATVGNSDNNYGLVHGLEPGSVTLTAAAVSGPTATAAVTVTDIPDDAGTAPQARFSLAFGSATLDAYPNWTAIDDYPNLVTSYSIDRGRDYELDQFDTGTATVQILDPDGILDPTNPDGPFYGLIRPLLRAAICRRNPVTNIWRARYSGWVDEYTYELDPSQQVNQLTITLVDLFELCSSAELQPGAWGTNTDHGDIEYPSAPADVRIKSVLRELRIPDRLSSLLYSPTIVARTVYSPGESALTAIQEAADAEFPGVGNVYVDRIGRMCFHGRRGRFDPEGVSASVGDIAWNYHEWTAGDGAAVNASPADTAQVRALSYSRGLSKIINSAVATPQGARDSEIKTQRVTDKGSIRTYGIRAWSASNLLTRIGDRDETHPSNALTETRRFARFFLHNYKQARRRINEITFRSVEPKDTRDYANWELLCLVDVGDTVTVTVANPGGGGFVAERYFVEGVREEARAGTPEYDDVTVTLDLSPRSYYSYDPWETPLTAADAVWSPKKSSQSGKPKPTVHAGDHDFDGPDPYEMQYENVGDPIGDGGGDVDLTGYIHYSSRGGGNEGDALEIATTGEVISGGYGARFTADPETPIALGAEATGGRQAFAAQALFPGGGTAVRAYSVDGDAIDAQVDNLGTALHARAGQGAAAANVVQAGVFMSASLVVDTNGVTIDATNAAALRVKHNTAAVLTVDSGVTIDTPVTTILGDVYITGHLYINGVEVTPTP